MQIDLSKGLLIPCQFLVSSNYDERPMATIIDMIVIHGISLPPAQFGNDYVEQFFTGKLAVDHHPYFATIAELKVSSHLFIKRTGDIIQFVPFHLRAWHAGQSIFQERERCNDFSIGIELEGTDDLPYEKIQYVQLAVVIKLLQQAYPAISRDRIVGHSDIAPGRKTDPGEAFDWQYLDCLLDASKA